MKGITGKSKIKSTNLPINKAHFYVTLELADAFNDFFTNIGQKLASQIPKLSKTFETYINKVNVILDSIPLLINKLKDTFLSPKISKSLDVGNFSFNIIKISFGVLCEPFYFIHLLKMGYFQII